VSGPWHNGWRAGLPALFAREWDLLVIGGGITGAGILLEAARRGMSALLVEQRDFAWGTSSRSSKLVHGGLRYLAEGRLRLTREAVHEREALLRAAPGLVERQGFAFADYGAARRRSFLLALSLYDLFAGRREQHWRDADDFAMLAPNVRRTGLRGAIVYTDAKTDDARLVLRVLREAQRHGGAAVNYAAAQSLLESAGRVAGAVVHDAVGGGNHEVRARLVVDATGAWAGALGGATGAPKLRPLRGSHLVLPAWRLPLAQSVSLMHPIDGRPVFAFPWEGVTLVGTTDVDHAGGLRHEAAITRHELDYLMTALQAQFPQLGLTNADVLSTFAGVRPVIAHHGGDGAPSKEGREHAVWSAPGLVGVTGGKLTTFRAIAQDVLRHAQAQLPECRQAGAPSPLFEPVAIPKAPRRLPRAVLQRLAGRYGGHAQALLDAAASHELDTIAGTETLWAELRWAARAEGVQQLDDLMLRRTRLGLQLRGGGAAVLERVRATCQPELGWSDERWEREVQRYTALWAAHYSLPLPDTLPGHADA
jgi:glycerol-3-phosphate dehydrogenase